MSKKIEFTSNHLGIPTFNWKGHAWMTRPVWGDHHENEPLEWIDINAPYLTDNNEVVLPMLEKASDRPFARSWMETVEEFKYGTFEWKVKLPQGKFLWPALWLASNYSWPPEIDALEGWSFENPQYVKRLLWKNIHPTMHWNKNCDSVNGEHLSEAKYNVWRWWIKGNGKTDAVKCVWTPNYIDVYYNCNKVSRFSNKEMLEHMNKPEVKMHPIMSMSIQESEYEKDAKHLYEMTDYVIQDFKYFPL